MNLKKYNQGIEDRLEGFPPNRFMRSDPEYMAGYNSGRMTVVTEAPKDEITGDMWEPQDESAEEK